MFSSFDERMMQRAIELAALGLHTTPPNPSVGCVVTQGDRVVGEGWHRKWGEPHAEPLALNAAGEQAKGATVYVTLEPHSYQGRTPPCTEALIRAGVRRVVIGVLDANPKVSGDGVRQLQAAGVDVQVGLLAEAARELNLGFEKRMVTGLPRLIVKSAISLDGRIALANGQSKWITGEAARADVQRLRSRMSAVLTSVGTLLADDPQLNVRDPSIDMLGRQPLRVVLDSTLRTPPTAAMLKLPGETLVFTGATADAHGGVPSLSAKTAAAADELRRAGADVIAANLDPFDRIDLDFVLRELGRRMCNDVLVEAGPTLVGRILQLGLADEVIAYVAPMLLGPDARAMANLPPVQALDQAQRYTMHAVERIGDDVKLTLRRRF
jgi:diaminohydroxyphosphoribosylaminopyrimidine deaminase/5-amino-6-(5-phosphoribosylamino)uracil reductase